MITITEAQLSAWLSPLIWPFLRLLAVFTVAPVFSNRAFPMRAKIGLAFFVALAAQASLPAAPTIGLNDPGAVGAIAQQVGIGLALGFAVRVVFAAVELAGEVIGLQMGLGFASFFDPGNNTQVSATARYFGNMMVLLFVVVNGHLMLIMATVKSFEAFPVGGNVFEAFNRIRLFELGANLFASALWIALPMLAILMFLNVGLGIVSRIAPQFSIFSIGFPLTLIVGLIGMALTLPMLDEPVLSLMQRTIDLFNR